MTINNFTTGRDVSVQLNTSYGAQLQHSPDSNPELRRRPGGHQA